MALPQQPPSAAPPQGGPPQGMPPQGQPGQPPSGPGQGGDAGQEVIQAIKILTLFAQAQKQKGNDGPAQALQAFMQSLTGDQGPHDQMDQAKPGEMPDRGQMSMNANKGATPVM